MKLKSGDEIEYIARKLSQELSETEERQFQLWLQEDPAHGLLFQEMEAIYIRSKQLKLAFEPDVERALQKVKTRRLRISALRYVVGKYAALFLLAVGIGLYVWLQGPHRSGEPAPETSRPGTATAVLHLATGEKIVLQNRKKGTYLKHTQTSDIWLDSNRMLQYCVKGEVAGEVGENTLEVPVGGEYSLTLGDGTRVWLNAATRLTYPEVFQGRERVVQLTGEAFFEVKTDTVRPFIVETQGMKVRVLGTTFNVKAYPDELKLYTTLVKGKVEVSSDHSSKRVVLQPGEQAVSDSAGIQKRQVNLHPYISWKEGKFVFINTPLEDICKQITRWYDVEIQFVDAEIRKVRFTGAILKFRPLNDLLEMIEVTSQVEFKRRGKVLLLQNK